MTQEELDLRLNAPKILRTHCYVLPAKEYEISCPLCETHNIEWSEYEGHIWCYDCKKDVLLSRESIDGGVFSGPIPINTARLLGLVFDRINLITKEIVPFDTDNFNDTWVYDEQLQLFKYKLDKLIIKQYEENKK